MRYVSEVASKAHVEVMRQCRCVLSHAMGTLDLYAWGQA